MNVAPKPVFSKPAGVGDSHADIFGSVYVNPVGHPIYVSEKPTDFPEGSVIVREKISGKQPLTPELLTVMVKRARGFNPASNDWEYMVLDGTGSSVLSRGKIDSCNSCHSKKKEEDFVFRRSMLKWVPARP